MCKLVTAFSVCGALVAPVAAVHSAEQVVLESTAAAYAPGARMDTAATITLAAREFVVVATDDGKLVRVEGPHNGPAAAGVVPNDNAVRRALAQLVSSGRPQVGGIGAVRGTAEDAAADSRTDPWLLHAEHNGDQCVLAGRPATVWREDAAATATTHVTDAALDETARIDWPATAHEARWPDGLPAVENRIYFLRPGDSQRSIAVRLHVLSPELSANPLAAAAWLAARGCMEQARILLR